MLVSLGLAMAVGLAMGLFGGGGSLLSVAILSLGLGMPLQSALFASLLIIGVSSTAALFAQGGQRLLSLRAIAALGAPGAVGAFLGARLAFWIPQAVLLAALGVLMLLTSLALLSGVLRAEGDLNGAAPAQPASPRRLGVLALGMGVVTGLLGAGGGFLLVPALVLHGRMPLKRALATSLALIALQSFAGCVGHLGQAHLDWAIVLPFTLLATLGSIAGGRLARRAPQELLRQGSAVLILLIALAVVARGLPGN